jgi:hypothetical protein
MIPVMPFFIVMLGVAVILLGVVMNLWWVWVIGIIIFLYPFVWIIYIRIKYW